MLTILAYILTLVLSQFAYSIASLIIAGILSFAFIFLPSKIRVPFVSIISHIATVLVTIGFGYLIFWLLKSNFGLLPGLVTILSALIPISGNFKERIKIRNAHRAAKYTVDLVIKEAEILDSSYTGIVIGDILGIVIGIIWLLLR